MSISSSGSSSPIPDWDPSMMGEAAGPEEKAEIKDLDLHPDDEMLNPAAMSKKQSVAEQSAAISDYASDSEIGLSRYEKLRKQTATSAGKGKLKAALTKMQHGARAFITGFGSFGSKISAKKDKEEGAGESLLPSDLDVVREKGKNVSSMMQHFYLDASGMISDDTTSSDDSLISIGSQSSLSSHLLDDHYVDVNQDIENRSITSFGSFQGVHADELSYSLSPQELYTSRISGEEQPRLLDSNVETASLVRRLSRDDMNPLNESVDSFNLSNTAFIFSNTNQNYSAVETDFFDESAVAVNTSEDQEDQNINEVKEESQLSLTEEQKRQQLIQEQQTSFSWRASRYASIPSGIYSSSASPSKEASFFMVPKKDNTILSGAQSQEKLFPSGHSYLGRSSNIALRGLQRSLSLDLKLITGGLHREHLARFPIEDHQRPLASSVTDFKSSLDVSQTGSSPSHDISKIPINPDDEASNGNWISSAFLFSSNQGMSVSAPNITNLEQHKLELEDYEGPLGPPDRLIYQYRNVAIDPPLILRTPMSSITTNLKVVHGKSSAAAAYNDDHQDSSDQKEKEHDEDDKDDEDDDVQNKDLL